MRLTINGKEETIEKNSVTVAQLLTEMNVEMPDMVSVELNGDFLERENYDGIEVQENDRVEFLYFMGGGSLIG
ncbi:MAG: sulfur carrier protein ThiS [Spirochaetia bacterium]|nr:sulfur carrier protein ThiS [Spirochaetia bacterium]